MSKCNGPSRMTKPHEKPAIRWCLECAYDGTLFSGWQSQPSGNGVQDFIERRLETIFRIPVRIHGSGRTDAGVHARGQVFHFDADWPYAPDKMRVALGVGVPRTIQIKRVKRVGSEFHARFSAIGKRYIYRIYEGDADPFTDLLFGVWNVRDGWI